MTHRIHNFCAGPCTLPLTVLEEARAELTDFQGCGMSVLEISHRSARFEALHHETLALASRLIGAPDDFQALFLPGGAHQQFDMIPLNLLADGGSAAYINSGIWAEKALKEAQRVGDAREIWTGRDSGFTTLPDALPPLSADCRYLYLTSNETISGVQYRDYPTTVSRKNSTACGSAIRWRCTASRTPSWLRATKPQAAQRKDRKEENQWPRHLKPTTN